MDLRDGIRLVPDGRIEIRPVHPLVNLMDPTQDMMDHLESLAILVGSYLQRIEEGSVVLEEESEDFSKINRKRAKRRSTLLRITGSLSMSVKTELLKVKMSRSVRGTFHRIKERFSRDTEGSPDNIFGEDIIPDYEKEREKKLKSTSVVFLSGSAMGVSHAVAAGVKFGNRLSRRSTIGLGVAVGAATAGVWYNCVDAAADEVTEEDIMMMFDMLDNTGLGSYTDNVESAKAVDILHTMVTGKTMDISEIKPIEFEDDKEDDDDFSDDDDPFSPKKDKRGSESAEPSIGRTTRSRAERSRRTYIPVLEREAEEEIEADRQERSREAQEGWLSLT